MCVFSIKKTASVAIAAAAIALTAGAASAVAAPQAYDPPSIAGSGCPNYIERTGNGNLYGYTLLKVWAPNGTFYVGDYNVRAYLGGGAWWNLGTYEYRC